MRWIDYFFGPPGKDKFARLMLAELAKTGFKEPLKYDPEHFLLRQESGFINLANIYQEYCQAPRSERAKVLARFIQGSLSTRRFELPEDFEDVHPDLLPVIRSRFQFEAVRLQAQVRGSSDKVSIPQQLIGDHLALSLVYDLPHAMRSIGQQELDNWNVTFYEAVEAARHNLEQMNNFAVASLDDRVFATATGDNYDASRLLLTDVIRTFPVRGQPVAMVPNRDTLLIAGQDDPEGLQLLATLADEASQKPRPISGAILTLEDDEWQTWLPDPASPAYNRLHELQLRSLGGEYTDQKELLEQLHSKRGEGLFVSPFSGVQNSQTGHTASYCCWPRGVPTLLPETEQVFFLTGNPQQPEHLASATWEKVQQVVGHLLQVQDCYPPRYLVSDFPNDRQLAQLGKLA